MCPPGASDLAEIVRICGLEGGVDDCGGGRTAGVDGRACTACLIVKYFEDVAALRRLHRHRRNNSMGTFTAAIESLDAARVLCAHAYLVYSLKPPRQGDVVMMSHGALVRRSNSAAWREQAVRATRAPGLRGVSATLSEKAPACPARRDRRAPLFPRYLFGRSVWHTTLAVDSNNRGRFRLDLQRR